MTDLRENPERRDTLLIEHELHIINEKLDAIKHAFPDGDFAGHHATHMAMIRAAQAQEDFWREMKIDIAKKGAWGLLIIILGLILAGISAKFGVVK